MSSGAERLTGLISAKGDILEVVLADPKMPPGVFINEDPPGHTMHRAMSTAPSRRRRCGRSKIRSAPSAPRAWIRWSARIVRFRLGPWSGDPHEDDRHARRHPRRGAARSPGARSSGAAQPAGQAALDQEGAVLRLVRPLASTSPWREKNPSDDLITQLLECRVRRTKDGHIVNLTKGEIIVFIAVVAGAGVETTGRLFGWMGKVLAEHPDQRQGNGRGPLPSSRGAIEELLRYEPPGPHVARYVGPRTSSFRVRRCRPGSALL